MVYRLDKNLDYCVDGTEYTTEQIAGFLVGQEMYNDVTHKAISEENLVGGKYVVWSAGHPGEPEFVTDDLDAAIAQMCKPDDNPLVMYDEPREPFSY